MCMRTNNKSYDTYPTRAHSLQQKFELTEICKNVASKFKTKVHLKSSKIFPAFTCSPFSKYYYLFYFVLQKNSKILSLFPSLFTFFETDRIYHMLTYIYATNYSPLRPVNYQLLLITLPPFSFPSPFRF